MRLHATHLCLTLLAAMPLCARWDDPEAGIPLLRRAPDHDARDVEIVDTVVDLRGRLYCSAARIYEFDGETWQSIPMEEGNVVLSLTLDGNNRIWYGGVNDLGHIDEDAAGRRVLRSLRSHLPPRSAGFKIWGTHRHRDQTLFVGVDELLVWDGVRFDSRPMPAPRRLFSFVFEGSVHISQPKTGLWRWDDAGLSAVELGGYEHETIQAAWRDAAGSTVFLGSGKLIRVADGKATGFAHETISRIHAHNIAGATPLPDGNIAILTVTDGTAIISPEGDLVRKVRREDGLPSLYSSSLSPSGGGMGWLSGGHGLIRLDTRNRQTLFSERTGIGGEGLRVIAVPGQGILALTAEGIGSLSPRPPGAARLEPWPAISGKVLDLALVGEQTAVASSMRACLELTPTGARPLFDSIEGVTHIAPLPSRPAQAAIIEGESLALVDLSRAERPSVQIKKLPDIVSRLAADPAGTAWVSFFREGLLAVDQFGTEGQSTRVLKPGAELPAAFQDAGLSVLNGDTFAFTPEAIVALPATANLAPRVILPGVGLLAAERSGTDSLWAVATTNGREPRLVQIIRRSTGHVDLRVTDQIIRDAGSIANLSRTQQHILWVGGTAGHVRIDAREVADEPAPQAPILQAVIWRAGGQATRLTLEGAPTVDFARTGTIEFQLRDGADPFAPTQLIETRLAGTEEDWRLTGKSRSIGGLDENTYTLEARVVGFLGNPGPVVRYTFTITPPWFRTPLAYLGYVLLFGGSLYSAAQWRTRRIRRQNIQLEQLVNRRTEELAQAVSARSAFLANMGHEIRNPLNGVVGLVDTLRARALADEEKGIVARIGTCADQLISVIDDVLEYARIDAGRIALRNRAFPVREPVEAAIDILRAARPEATIELQGDAGALDPHVMGDPDRIRHILVNYVSNALKFGGGTPVQVAVHRDGPLLVFSVTDHGPGIAPEEQARLFVRFSRGSAAYRHGIPGTGLGLAACKAYAEAMGGDVSVESQPGQGATFFLRLPFRPATESVDDTTAASRPDLMVGKRALVVDDQDFNRFVLADLLGRMGATTDQASSLEEARAAFRARTPDIVFVDFDLAGATGADLATWIRKEAPFGRDVPVVATTAFEVDEVRRRCDEAGMDGFLAKPVTARRLAEVVARIEAIRSGGPAPAAPTADPAATMPSSFLDILAGGDPDKRREIERSTWREVLTEALAAHRALRRDDAALTARHAHRLVSAALILSERELVADARELNAVAKAGDLPAARLAADRLRARIRKQRHRKVT